MSTRTLCTVAVLSVLGVVGSASAGTGFTSVQTAPVSELGHRAILQNIYGGTWASSGAVNFGNGSILATRITDNVTLPAIGAPAILPVTPLSGGDTTWIAPGGPVPVTVKAKFAADNSIFGWFDDTSATPIFIPIVNTSALNTTVNVLLSANFRFALSDISTGKVFTTRPADNSGIGTYAAQTFDQAVTYYVSGLPGGQSEWAIFWEDRVKGQSSDYDYNDSVVTVSAVPAPGAAPALALAGLFAARRRRAR